MITQFLTPRHEITRDHRGTYRIRNREAGTEQKLYSIDSFLLDQDLRACPIGQWDNVLRSWEGGL